jgi:hypothetical protein
MRDAVTAQATAPSWTWQEPPPSRAPIRVPVTPARWRVGQPTPPDDDPVPTEDAHILGTDVATSGIIPPDLGDARDQAAAGFAAKLAALDLAPACGGIRLWEHTRPGFPVTSVWAYTLPTRHQFLDPHPVDPGDVSIDLPGWVFRAGRAVAGADQDRKAADWTAPQVEWTFRCHPATIRDLMKRDWAAERTHSEECFHAAKEASQAPGNWTASAALLNAPPPSPVLAQSWTPDGGNGWTINGHRLEKTTRVEPGMLHAHQILPAAGATP